ncbi:MAG: tRNA preQ1(34) S-adenosylmethionine ribosyltransferase-isomerase QueA [Rhodospirillaceae bacterium]|nr:tRNA preQ1(34) S-adenosylmethionine ribosyltransferase-isomerase QueA [Rhodospirillaceae bacterium]|tara:strand:- start:6803 stop:7834 length:1032 start_codon:yes stop_codon:yes gene_type:complete
MKTDIFDFELPKELIAQQPASPRDSARLLHVGNVFTDLCVRDLPRLFSPGDVLVLNNTKVIPARLRGKRHETSIEITLHKLNRDGSWCAFARPARKLKAGDVINFAEDFSARISQKLDSGEIIVNFSGQEFTKGLEENGSMPLPPYIDRKTGSHESDHQSYQTVYAAAAGAVAAPTAGLHFTEELLTEIRNSGVEVIELTLHVGAGTFLPVKVDDTEDHKMHSEWGKLNQTGAEKINAVRGAGGRVIACGTTVLRLLESASIENDVLMPFEGDTDIFITPGYKFRIVDRLMTNFHLPCSTLFMLVSAFAGLERMKDAYQHAINSGYRFYSYGDACLLDRDEIS